MERGNINVLIKIKANIFNTKNSLMHAQCSVLMWIMLRQDSNCIKKNWTGYTIRYIL
jgi:hypothetical protein